MFVYSSATQQDSCVDCTVCRWSALVFRKCGGCWSWSQTTWVWCHCVVTVTHLVPLMTFFSYVNCCLPEVGDVAHPKL